ASLLGRGDCRQLPSASLPDPAGDQRDLVHHAVGLYSALPLRPGGLAEDVAARMVGFRTGYVDVLGGAGQVCHRRHGLAHYVGPARVEIGRGHYPPGHHVLLHDDRDDDPELLPARRAVGGVFLTGALVPPRIDGFHLHTDADHNGGPGRTYGYRRFAIRLAG